MPYNPRLVPQLASLLPWLQEELHIIQTGLIEQTDVQFVQLNTWHEEPAKLFDGLTVLADGTDWNPGSGQGVYTYYNATWNKLG